LVVGTAVSGDQDSGAPLGFELSVRCALGCRDDA
jgi:hypothetical protein